MAAMTEIIEWFSVDETLPDSDCTVLVIECGEVDVWPGYLDGEQWRSADGCPLDDIVFWAHMPGGPKQ